MQQTFTLCISSLEIAEILLRVLFFVLAVCVLICFLPFYLLKFPKNGSHKVLNQDNASSKGAA